MAPREEKEHGEPKPSRSRVRIMPPRGACQGTPVHLFDERNYSYDKSTPGKDWAEARYPIVVVNAAAKTPVNCTSGGVDGFRYVHALRRTRELARTGD